MAAVPQIVPVIYLFLLCFAAVSDFRKLRIPNWISLALIALFAFDMLLAGHDRAALHHLGVAVAAFAVGLVLYIFGWWAAGDVKLMAAVALWAGPPKALELVLLTGVLGGFLAIGILMARRAIKFYGLDMTAAKAMVPNWVKLGLCPYGVAIAAAGIAVQPFQS